MQHAVVYACVRVLSEAIALLPLHVYEIYREWEKASVKISKEYDEEEDKYYENEWTVRYDVCIFFWKDKNYEIVTEAELKD